MHHRYRLAASVGALALLVISSPVLAQQAAPAAGERGPAASAERGQRTISGRDLMTPEERRAFRAQMEQATPEQRDALWTQKRADLEQRAAQRGATLAEPGAGRNGGSGERGEGRHQGQEGAGRGEGGSMLSRMMGWGPRAP